MALANVLLLVSACAAASVNSNCFTNDTFRLSLIHMNDFHARFEPTSWNSGSCPPGKEDQCIGGIARIYTAVRDLKKTLPNAIFFNAGDNYQGTLWYTLFKWNATLEFMNKLPHDAMTLGNHEFDDEMEGIIPFIEGANFPIVVANIDDSEETEFQGLCNKSVIIERSGRKIGIIGYILNTTNEISKTKKVKFLDHVDSVNREATRLKTQGVDIIIGLSHGGIDVDEEVARNVPEIDVIVGGHSHTLLYNGSPPGRDIVLGPYPVIVQQPNGKKVPIVQAYAFTKYLGNFSVAFDSNGEVICWEGNPILMNQSISEDPDILEAMRPYKKLVSEQGNVKIGSTKVLLDASNLKCSRSECNIGNMFAQAMVDEYVSYAKNGSWTYAAIAITNSGGIRASIEESNNGVITFGDLLTTQPFHNTIDTVELQGRYLKMVLEQAVSKKMQDFDYFVGKGFLQHSGIQVTYNLSQPIGCRIRELSVLCAECRVPQYQSVDDNKWYRIAINSFLAEGGDGYKVIKDNVRNRNIGRLDFEVFLDYLKKHNPIIQEEDGRIQMI